MRKIICLILSGFGFTQISFSQPSISGSQCVTTGTVYQYLVTGQITSGDSLHVCITGGKLDDLVNTCTDGMFSQVKVIWDENIATGSISISSAAGNSSLNVTITAELNAGSISSSKTQVTSQDSIPVSIQCQAASGGGCSPVYAYQWEQSADQANWEEMANRTEQDLNFFTAVSEPTYYRRKVTEINSGTIKYSDVASVFVTPTPK